MEIKMSETQQTVTEWCDRHYPGMDARKRLFDLFEEVSELAVAMDVATNEDILAHVAASLKKSEKDRGNPAEVPGELGDIQIATHWLASLLGYNSVQVLDDKMEINYEKTEGDSQARLLAKQAHFDHL
jgi:NTP pyrophosphatase (non-canonical NTP hydrolase)